MSLNLKNHKILLIEDYAIMRTSIKGMLHFGEAQNIVESHNAQMAIVAMEKQKFDIVICDYHLGSGKNGQQLLEEAKHRKLLPYSTIFIMVTAEQTATMVMGVMENKPDDYLAKPFNVQQLLSRIEKQVARKAYFADIDAAIAQDDLPLAINHCEKLLAQNDLKMHTQLLKIGAELAINVGDFAKAQGYYHEILLQRELVWAIQGLGVVAFLQNQFDKAIQLFKEVLQKAPMMIETYDWLAKAYEAVNQLEDAQKTLKQAVELSPQMILRQRKLAVLAEQVGDHEVAIKAYKSAIKLGQNSVYKSSQDLGGLAKLYAKEENQSDTLKLIKEMRDTYKNNPEAELRAACLETRVYVKQKDRDLISQAYAKLKPINRHTADISKELLLEIAETHYLTGNHEASKSLIADLIDNYVDDEVYISELIRRYQAFSHDELYAADLFKHAKQQLIDTNNRGVSLFKQGQVKAAIALLETAHIKTPHNKFILINLAKMLLENMKANGVTQEQRFKLNDYILKASKLDVAQDKVGSLKMGLTKLTSR